MICFGNKMGPGNGLELLKNTCKQCGRIKEEGKFVGHEGRAPDFEDVVSPALPSPRLRAALTAALNAASLAVGALPPLACADAAAAAAAAEAVEGPPSSTPALACLSKKTSRQWSSTCAGDAFALEQTGVAGDARAAHRGEHASGKCMHVCFAARPLPSPRARLPWSYSCR